MIINLLYNISANLNAVFKFTDIDCNYLTLFHLSSLRAHFSLIPISFLLISLSPFSIVRSSRYSLRLSAFARFLSHPKHLLILLHQFLYLILLRFPSSLSPISHLRSLNILCVSRGFGTILTRSPSPPKHVLILLHQFLHIRMCARVIQCPLAVTIKFLLIPGCCFFDSLDPGLFIRKGKLPACMVLL